MAASIPCSDPDCDKTFRTESGRDSHAEKAHPLEVLGTVAEETEKAIAAAKGHLLPEDAGSLAVLRRLARQIDGLDVSERFDNTLMPTYLRFADQLGLTPLGRMKLGTKKEKPKGRLGTLRSIEGGRAS